MDDHVDGGAIGILEDGELNSYSPTMWADALDIWPLKAFSGPPRAEFCGARRYVAALLFLKFVYLQDDV